MKIVVAHPDREALAGWLGELSARLPAARVVADGDAPADDAPAADAPADYAVGWLPPAGFFARHRRLKAFFGTGAGVDGLLRHPGLPAALPVFRLEDAGMARSMADYCLHEILRIAGRRDEYAALQAQRRWHELPEIARADLPVGVLGLGVLGGHVARTLAAHGWPVGGFARTPRRIEGVTAWHGRDGWHPFLAATRVLIVLAPLTPATEDIVDADALARLRPGGWLINVARGRLVVDDDLVAALDRGTLAGATLDVFREEPLPAGHPFWTHPRIRITPHVSAVTRIPESAAQVATGLLALERGEAPAGRVDRGRGY